MPTIKKTKRGFHISHTTKEVFGVDDLSEKCYHDWQEQEGEPPYDVCISCGQVRY